MDNHHQAADAMMAHSDVKIHKLIETEGNMMKAAGNFDVNLQPLDTYAMGDGGINLGRMSIDKVFNGDLTAKSKGEMLSAMTIVKGSLLDMLPSSKSAEAYRARMAALFYSILAS